MGHIMPKNQLIRYLCVLLSWFSVFVTRTFAGESVGVNIKLVSGEKLSGYIDWNPERMSVDTMMRKVNAKELPLRQYVNGGRAYYKFSSPLMFFKKFVRIKYPVQTYVAVNEDKREIQFSEISQIEVNPKLDIKVEASGMIASYNVPAEHIPQLNRRPLWYVVEDQYGFWKRYFIAVSDEARISDVVDLWGSGIKSIVSFGELLYMFKREGFGQFVCLGTSKNELMLCDKAKGLWNELGMDGDEIAKCYSDVSEGSSSKKSVKESGSEKARTREDCYLLEENVEKKYFKNVASSQRFKGLIVVILPASPTILDDKKDGVK